MTTEDKELAAITAVVSALTDLDDESRARVLEYASKRFRISLGQQRATTPDLFGGPVLDAFHDAKPARPGSPQTDIKALKEEKQPSSGIQMAVLVAYYLKELAPDVERKDAIAGADIEKYFNQARYALPTGKNGPTDTLNNARRAGYFESAGTGLFKLNSVGFNLAAYNMPTESNRGRSVAAKPKPRKAKKAAKKA